MSGITTERYSVKQASEARYIALYWAFFRFVQNDNQHSMNKYLISVDWLQVYCRYTDVSLLLRRNEFKSGDLTVVIKDADIQTAMFKSVLCVYERNMELATIQYKPRSSKLDERMVLLKLSNRVLYHAKFVKVLYDLIDALGLTYRGITRIDVCYDCQRFKDNRSPSRFINEFVSKSNVSAHDIRKKGSEEFTCHGKKPKGGSAKINYIRFGSPQSKISAYIYDKSLELEEVHDKPWIREAWIDAGLDEEKGHIFRSEISIKAEGTDLLDMSSGELFRLSPDMLESQIRIEELFSMYAKKYLSFSIDKGQKRKKDFTKLELFEYSEKTRIRPIQISRSADTGRIEKVCFNVLDRLSSTYTDLSEYHRNAIAGTQQFLRELSGIKTARCLSQAYESYLNQLRGYMFSDKHFNNYVDSLVQSQNIYRAIQEEMCENDLNREVLPILEPYYPNEVSLPDEQPFGW